MPSYCSKPIPIPGQEILTYVVITVVHEEVEALYSFRLCFWLPVSSQYSMFLGSFGGVGPVYCTSRPSPSAMHRENTTSVLVITRFSILPCLLVSMVLIHFLSGRIIT